MYFIFTFCDCSPWIPWLLPFLLGWFFGMRMIGRYRSKIEALESSRMKDSNRVAELEQDIKMSQTKLELEEDSLKRARQRITEVEAQLALAKGSLYEIEEQSKISTDHQSQPTKSIGLKAAAVASSAAYVTHEISEKTENTSDDALSRTIVESTDSITEPVIDQIETSNTDVSERPAFQAETTTEDNTFIDSQTLNNEIEVEPDELEDIVNDQIATDDTIETKTENFSDIVSESASFNKTDDIKKSDSPTISESISENQTEKELITDQNVLNETTELKKEGVKDQISELESFNKTDDIIETDSPTISESISDFQTEKTDEFKTNQNLLDETIESKTEELKDQIPDADSFSTIDDLADTDRNLSEDLDAKNQADQIDMINPITDNEASLINVDTAADQDQTIEEIDHVDEPSDSASSKSGFTEKLGLTAAAAAIGSGSILSKKDDTDTLIQKTEEKAVASKTSTTVSKDKTRATKTAKKKNAYVESGFKQAGSGRFQNVEENDLSAIEGVGPKTAEVLKKNGIKSWSDLATKTPLEIKEILATSGSRFSHIDPSSWPRQAKLASGNHWTRLEKLQDEMDGGKISKSTTKAKKAKTKSSVSKANPASTKKKAVSKKKSSKSVTKKSTSKGSAKTSTKTGTKTGQTATSKIKSKASAKAKSQKKALKKTDTKSKKLVAKSKLKSKSAVTATSKKKKSSKTKSPKISVGRAVKTSNLQIIEGVGPKMNELLAKEGISSWSKLASFSPAQLRTKLEKHGDRYRIIDVKTWPKQAAYASKGQWNKLIQFQKKDGSDSKAEKILQKAGVFDRYKKNDLKVIEGIGPKIEELLQNAGIKTWAALSKASKTKLSNILNKAGKRYGLADPSSWPKQAGLAAAGKFDKLEALQKKL